MKKLLFLINTLSGGGAEKVLVDTVNNVNCDKYDITVQTVYDVGVFKSKLADNIRYKSIIRTQNKTMRKILSKVLFSVLGTRFVYQYFVCTGYDYEIAFLEGLPTKIISSSTNKKCRKYAWVHTDIEKNPNSFRVFGSADNERAAYTHFDKIFCVSNSVREAFNRKYGMIDKTKTVYNIIDDAAIVAASVEHVDFLACPKPVFITVGRLTKPKGYERLLRVHKRLVEEGYRHSLLLIGDGEQRTVLEEYIRENNLGKTAFLLGFQSNPYKFISKCDLFICSSFAEGYSTVVSESVLCGTPVLSTKVAGCDEPIENPRCSIIVDNSEEAIYEGLKDLLKNPESLKIYQEQIENIQYFLKKSFLVSEFEHKVLGDLKY